MANMQQEQEFKVVVAQDLGLQQETGFEISPVGFSQCVRTLIQNWRQGTVACKGRSDVAFSNKKPWKQKGTGRARAGSARSPLWRGGGVIFGPQPRVRTLKVSKALKQNVFKALLYNNLNNNAIFALDFNRENDAPNTKQAYNALVAAQLANKKAILFVSAHDYKTHASFANIPSVKILLFDQPNAYDLADSACWIFLKKDMNAFKEMVNKWI